MDTREERRPYSRGFTEPCSVCGGTGVYGFSECGQCALREGIESPARGWERAELARARLTLAELERYLDLVDYSDPHSLAKALGAARALAGQAADSIAAVLNRSTRI
jgi:hypothetical protein